MESYEFLLFLAVILAATKIFGLISKKMNMPQVVGALIAGILIGPSVFNIITLQGSNGSYISMTAEIGVIILMFTAGLETELSDLKENFVPSLLTAILGIILPLIGGFVLYSMYFQTDSSTADSFLKALFIGVVLTATSVSITVETLREMGKLKGKIGTTILGAAIIDDVIGIVILTVTTSFMDARIKPQEIVFKIVLYFLFLAVVAFLIYILRNFIEQRGEKRRVTILALAFCFLMAYVTEHVFGIADITGAYFAGVMLCTLKSSHHIEKNLGVLSFLFFSPVFFASIGIKTEFKDMNASILIFAVLLFLVAVLTKLIGCGIGAKLSGFTRKESISVGIGMISRGEVALIVAQKGYDVGLIEERLFAPVVFMVILTTLCAPIMLKIAMKK